MIAILLLAILQSAPISIEKSKTISVKLSVTYETTKGFTIDLNNLRIDMWLVSEKDSSVIFIANDFNPEGKSISSIKQDLSNIEVGTYSLCIQATEVIDGVRIKGEKSPVTIINILPQDRGIPVVVEYEITF